jgi:hypothetical protein
MTDDDPFLAVREGARHRALAALSAKGWPLLSLSSMSIDFCQRLSRARLS